MLDRADVLSFLNTLECQVLENEPLSRHTTFKIGGKADFFVSVFNKADLKKLILFVRKNNIEYFIIGNGSNLLVNDDGFRGIAIKYCNDYIYIDENDKTKIICSSGVSLAKLCKFALNHSLSGLEFAWGIPGTVGGAVYMNAGAYDGQIKDVILSAEHITLDGEIKAYSKDELQLSYRKSAYSQNNFIITEATFALKPELQSNIHNKMEDLMNRRVSKQPIELPSAGSVFKRPEGYFAGTLIQDCGLKGKRIGGACVSTKHAGFIINDENASCKDVKNLIEFIQREVKEQKGVALECEIKML